MFAARRHLGEFNYILKNDAIFEGNVTFIAVSITAFIWFRHLKCYLLDKCENHDAQFTHLDSVILTSCPMPDEIGQSAYKSTSEDHVSRMGSFKRVNDSLDNMVCFVTLTFY